MGTGDSMRRRLVKELDRDLLMEYLDYTPETGALVWKKIPPNSRVQKIGQPVAKPQKARGRNVALILQMCGVRFYAHRAIWIITHGELSTESQIDHINGDPLDNRLSNLRLASHAENVKNRIRNGRLATGVYKNKRSSRFCATIQPTGSAKKIHLGTYATEAEAHAAYVGASVVLHGEFSPFLSRNLESFNGTS